MSSMLQFAASMSRPAPLSGAERMRRWRAKPENHKSTRRRGARSRVARTCQGCGELAMRQRTRKCQLCGVYMTSRHNKPNSKHLDHILPRNQGGTHTHGNVRIICARCNLRRPKDGSDFTGQLTLWAQGDISVSRPDRRHDRTHDWTTCRNGLHPWVPGARRCAPCRKLVEERRAQRVQRPRRECKCGVLFAASGSQFMCSACIDIAAHHAAELHAGGGLTWDQVAAQVGYTTAEGARYAAKRIGYAAPKPGPQPPRRLPCGRCGGPVPNASGQRTPICEGCRDALAWEAVALRRDGRTLRYIADQIGYDSITSVTNLLKTVQASDLRK